MAYTDGLTDTLNDQHECYDHTRLVEALYGGPGAAPDLLAHILSDLKAFAGPVCQPDDITLLILKSC